MPECHWPSPSAYPSWFTCRKWSLWALGWLQRRWRWKGVQRAKIWGVCRWFSLFRTYSSSLCVTLQKFHNFVSFGQKSCSCALGGGWCEQEAHHSGAGQLSADAAQTQRGPYRDSMETTETTIRQEPIITSFFSSSFSLQAVWVWVLWISFAPRPWVLRQLAEHCMSEISGKLGMQGDRGRS